MKYTLKQMGLFLFFACLLFLNGCSRAPASYDAAVAQLDRMVARVRVTDRAANRVELSPAPPSSLALADNLPAIDKYPVTVAPDVSLGDVVVEIFSSPHLSGKSKPDDWLTRIAQDFNQRGIVLSNGHGAKVRLRAINSGDGYQYIASRKYMPDAFHPSSHLWIEMLKAGGTNVTPITEQLGDNTAGVVMKDRVYAKLKEVFGTADVKTLLTAVTGDAITMGYTDPFSSSTGLNFLITVLATFAGYDEAKMLSPEVASAFEAFQQHIPFVCLTTLQMREIVQNGGSLDAFIMEHQSFLNTAVLKTGYVFIPFGVKHSNPLYAVGTIGDDKREVLSRFADFATSPYALRLVEEYGFGRMKDYRPAFKVPSGDTLLKAQVLWKKKKDANRPILAVFVADTSNSMNPSAESTRSPIAMLKNALIDGSNFINEINSIGLVSFNSEVTRLARVREFDQLQRAAFLDSVRSLSASGNTAMYDAIAVALQMVVEAKREVPEGRPMLFVLTDGQTNRGMNFSAIQPVLRMLQVPVYTIGYNANVAELKRLSSVNEAANLSADDQNISFVLSNILNAEM